MAELRTKNTRVLLVALALVAGMVGLSFASVPLYNLFCRVTGYGGTTQQADAAPVAVGERTFRIRFLANVDPNLDWDFEPEQREISVHVGQPALISYRAENHSDLPVAGTAVYNVTPDKAGIYFVKTQCFCFTEQILAPGQAVDMPVYFFVDPSIVDDPNLDDVTTITLSYTFYPTQSENLDEAVEDYYRSVEAAGAAVPPADPPPTGGQPSG
ncbi:MAG: cytochrome c oxidase assembly protein [Rhodospirillaceae bacterium]|nr:cytochrome c oxidase assembly protein [Rhodospirillaceae bacterium]